MSQRLLNPRARLASVAADQQLRRRAAVWQRPDQCRAEPLNRRRDRAVAHPPSANTVRTEANEEFESGLLATGDAYLHGRRIDAHDAAVDLRIDVHGESVFTWAKAGEIDPRRQRVRADGTKRPASAGQNRDRRPAE